MKNEANFKVKKYSVSSAAFGEEKKVDDLNFGDNPLIYKGESNIYYDSNNI